ncbi:MAG: PorT family protein [Duncaniella sp.]|nr:PorT family protein [Duncaniella sp.]
MKRSLIALLVAITALSAPFVSHAQMRWGVSAGVNVNDLKFKQVLFPVATGVGESLGMRGEMMFPGIGFGLELGLFYQQQGASLDLGHEPNLLWSSQGYGNERIYVHNISIPFNLKFKWTRMQGLEDYVAPFVYGGPVLQIQAGHSKCDALKFSGGDVELVCGLGFEIFKRWQVSASYTWGMTYALKTAQLFDVSARNRTWGFAVTYFLK